MEFPSSTPESINLSVALIEHYFHMTFQKHEILFPEDASWKDVDEFPSSNGHAEVFQKTLNIIFEIADLFEGTRVEKMVKKCERLGLNSSNLHNIFTETISVLLDGEITWGKVVIFFSFAVSFAIYLCRTNEMSHLAGQVSVWAAEDLQNRIQPWINVNGGWVSICINNIATYTPCISTCIKQQHISCSKVMEYKLYCSCSYSME